MLIALQRAGHLDRSELVRLQASYLNEANRPVQIVNYGETIKEIF